MSKTFLIKQSAGLGDIMFTQKIAAIINEKSPQSKIVWPIIPQFIEDVKYIKSYAQFCDVKDWLYDEHYRNNVSDESIKVVPIQDADQLLPRITSLLTCKYELLDIEWKDWAEYLTIQRNYDKEEDLFNRLDLAPEDDYILVSNNYGSPPNTLSREINLKKKPGHRIISVDFFEGVSVFDWCGVIEHASELHMVDTCFVYICEKLNMKSNNLNLYSRYNPADFSHIRDILSVKWKFTEWG